MAVLLALFALLPVLAVLQYRWVGKVSEMERQRMQSNLRPAADDFQQEFERRIEEIKIAIHGGRGGPHRNPRETGMFLAEWMLRAADRGLVRHFYLAELQNGVARLTVLDPESGFWKPAAWPDNFAPMRTRMETGMRVPEVAGNLPALVDDGSARGGPGRGERRDPDRPQRPPEGEPPDRDGLGPDHAESWTIAELDLGAIQKDLLPELAAKYLLRAEDGGYAMQVVSAVGQPKVIFQSDSGLPANFFAKPDFTFPLFDAHQGPPVRGRGPGGKRDKKDHRAPPPDDYRGPADEGAWVATVKHRSGSLEAAVSQARHRNLAISLGVMLVLGAALAVLFVSTRRAQWLSKLQMEFVAGVSHELRTPLAVICSAGDNLAHGVVTDSERVKDYGKLIEQQGRHLANMVEQVLAFAGAQSGRFVEPTEQVQVAEVIRSAVAACAPELSEAGMVLEQKIAEDLPLVLADPVALRHCLMNLLSNSSKYARDGKWVGIEAEVTRSAKPSVKIRVEDRGPGIHPDDLAHIFDPFYRGKHASAATVRGAGLGLSLVRRIAEAHGGSVEASSAPGHGACFTLSLPVAG